MNPFINTTTIACVGKVNSGKTSWCKRITVCLLTLLKNKNKYINKFIKIE